MAHLATDTAVQLQMFSESNLIDSIIQELGGKEIVGKEKIKMEAEMARQEETKKKIKGWLSWYDRN
ncbi:MAG: hypothetical protein WC099_03135 [Candidatus Paceibacterota bacterium]